MFNKSKYTEEYYEIMRIAAARSPSGTPRSEVKKAIGYVESHHIIPSSIGGDDSDDNLVWLTAEEHVRAHILLTKMVERDDHKRKMTMAAIRMITPQNASRDRESTLKDILSNYDLGEINKIREESAKLHGEYLSEKYRGDGNPFYGKSHTDEFKKNMSDKLSGVSKHPGHGKAVSAGRLKISDKISALVSGPNNPHYLPTIYEWENIKTGEKKIATRLEMTKMDKKLSSNISKVIHGISAHVRGWRIIRVVDVPQTTRAI
jgi:hypothetical protein